MSESMAALYPAMKSVSWATEENPGQLAAIPSTERTPFQALKLRECFLAEHALRHLREAKANVQRLQEERTTLLDSMPTVMVMEEMPVPRETFVFDSRRL